MGGASTPRLAYFKKGAGPTEALAGRRSSTWRSGRDGGAGSTSQGATTRRRERPGSGVSQRPQKEPTHLLTLDLRPWPPPEP